MYLLIVLILEHCAYLCVGGFKKRFLTIEQIFTKLFSTSRRTFFAIHTIIQFHTYDLWWWAVQISPKWPEFPCRLKKLGSVRLFHHYHKRTEITLFQNPPHPESVQVWWKKLWWWQIPWNKTCWPRQTSFRAGSPGCHDHTTSVQCTKMRNVPLRSVAMFSKCDTTRCGEPPHIFAWSRRFTLDRSAFFLILKSVRRVLTPSPKLRFVCSW
jgi:hypothetical protein